MNIVAREILDSRGNPTVEVDLHTGKGYTMNSLKSITHMLCLCFCLIVGLTVYLLI